MLCACLRSAHGHECDTDEFAKFVTATDDHRYEVLRVDRPNRLFFDLDGAEKDNWDQRVDLPVDGLSRQLRAFVGEDVVLLLHHHRHR